MVDINVLKLPKRLPPFFQTMVGTSYICRGSKTKPYGQYLESGLYGMPAFDPVRDCVVAEAKYYGIVSKLRRDSVVRRYNTCASLETISIDHVESWIGDAHEIFVDSKGCELILHARGHFADFHGTVRTFTDVWYDLTQSQLCVKQSDGAREFRPIYGQHCELPSYIHPRQWKLIKVKEMRAGAVDVDGWPFVDYKQASIFFGRCSSRDSDYLYFDVNLRTGQTQYFELKE